MQHGIARKLRGVEALPLRLTASIFLIAVVASVAFYELSVFMEFQTVKNFKEDLVDVRQAMRTLQSLGDVGSFTSVVLTVPGGYSVIVDNKTDRLLGKKGASDFFEVNLTGDLYLLSFPSGCTDANCTLEPGEYEIRLVYDYVADTKDYMMVFR